MVQSFSKTISQLGLTSFPKGQKENDLAPEQNTLTQETTLQPLLKTAKKHQKNHIPLVPWVQKDQKEKPKSLKNHSF